MMISYKKSIYLHRNKKTFSMNINQVKIKRRKLLRALFGLFSFSSAMFVFQACYGMPPDYGLDLYISGKVVAKSSNLPIEGIKVSVDGSSNYGVTDSSGFYSFYNERNNGLKFRFEDIDSTKNGYYQTLDSTLHIASDLEKISFNVALKEVK